MPSTRRPRRRKRRLPRYTLGTTVVAGAALIAAIQTWPIPAAAAGALGATILVTRAIHPRRRPARRARTRTFPRRTPAARIRRPAPRDSRTLAGFLAMSPEQFEHAVAALSRRHPDVRAADVQGGTGDRGLDVLATLHDGRRILIQCKRYRPGNNIGGPVVLHTLGAVRAHRCTTGVIVTTAGFTREALATNSSLGPDRLTLIDGRALVAWANGAPAPWQS